MGVKVLERQHVASQTHAMIVDLLEWSELVFNAPNKWICIIFR